MPGFLRHSPRHVHHTVAEYLELMLDELGWTSANEAERPFGAARVRPVRTDTLTDGKQQSVSAGTFNVTLGDEAPPEDLELGGPLSSQEFPIFIDILMEEDAIALSLAADVRDHLLGRFEFSRRYLPVIDQVTRTPVDGWRIALEDVERIKPDQRFALHWQVVKVTATAEFGEAIY